MNRTSPDSPDAEVYKMEARGWPGVRADVLDNEDCKSGGHKRTSVPVCAPSAALLSWAKALESADGAFRHRRRSESMRRSLINPSGIGPSRSVQPSP
jgi:hypothetical protein